MRHRAAAAVPTALCYDLQSASPCSPHQISPQGYALTERSARRAILINALVYPFWGFMTQSLDTGAAGRISDPLLPRLAYSAAGLVAGLVLRCGQTAPRASSWPP